ncbi:ABC transporter substrate-binding protein [Arsenicicoccus dermatophilus]|uniref:ABC transporter substrate-binding protein n=1 Tax=Arsenicicoccus dermatophilus TaxID=1076331 RepID=UPI003917597B
MMRTTKGALGVALGTAATLGLAACGGGGGGTTSANGSAGPAAKGGTLTVINLGPKEHLDPQRMYVGADILFGSRVYARTLTTYTAGEGSTMVPDLATDTGQMSDNGKTWRFTLVDNAKWQDGKPVTCEDVKYGVSRTFAQDVITGGPNYAITFLDLPTKKTADGEVPVYPGPYKPDAAGQAAFDKAVSCSGQTITFRFKKPWTDFNMNNAALTAFAPFRKDKDQGAKSDYQAFSNGPYMLEGAYDPNKGGTWVRNPNWSEASDKVRKAYPDKIVDTQGVQIDTGYQRLIADAGEDKTAIAALQAQAATLPQIESNPAAKSRSINVQSPYVDYLAPNVRSKTMANPKIRQAFAMATNRGAYITAYGGPSVMTPSFGMCNKALKCAKDFNPFGNDANGDVEGAKKLLQEAGAPSPLPITVVYRKRGNADKALTALKETWDKAGFDVTLQPIAEKYYSTIQAPGMADKDVFWAGWGADWPSGSTVLPALFDGRVNLTAGGSGQDYGYFDDPEVNAKIDAAYAIQDEAQREKAWADIDEMIGKKGGYVSLVNQKFTFLHGSAVKNFQVNPMMGGYPDLAEIAVR